VAAAGDLPAGYLHSRMDGAEGRGGEAGEHARVGGDGLGHALAAGQSGADELVGVSAVGFRARRADAGAAVPARQGDDPVGRVRGVEGVQDFAGGAVEVADGAAEPDRARAPAGGQGPGQPLVIIVAAGALEQLGVERSHAARAGRIACHHVRECQRGRGHGSALIAKANTATRRANGIADWRAGSRSAWCKLFLTSWRIAGTGGTVGVYGRAAA
jgi:hypothetical protein